jgi:hypothetical protein
MIGDALSNTAYIQAVSMEQIQKPIGIDFEAVSRRHIEQIISYLEIDVFKPEDEIIKQYDESHDMYFI